MYQDYVSGMYVLSSQLYFFNISPTFTYLLIHPPDGLLRPISLGSVKYSLLWIMARSWSSWGSLEYVRHPYGNQPPQRESVKSLTIHYPGVSIVLY